MIHQQSSATTELKAGPKINDAAYLHRMKIEKEKQQSVHAELRRHEMAGLIWIVVSPWIAGLSLQYSPLLFNTMDKYINAFNAKVFMMAASIKPLLQVILLLQERTHYLQNEANFDPEEAVTLEDRMSSLEKELNGLKRAYVTKKDLGQITEDINPAIQHLAKTIHRFEKKDGSIRCWSQQHFTAIEEKLKDFDRYICYRIEQDQRQQAHGVIVSLILLPLTISLWIAKCMSFWVSGPRKALLETPTKPTRRLSSHSQSEASLLM
ncbi:hypothetical protein BY458DRAFT_495891 [Sporodiniella umbellata]|nr:hypothetical protein BY458DRAFT_495891 [Sporodiniella umbellata]